MPCLMFTSHLAEVGPRSPQEVPGGSVRDALDAVFATYPRLKGYVLDDQGRVRRHVVLFVDGKRCANDEVLDLQLSSTSEVYVLQALSGGSF